MRLRPRPTEDEIFGAIDTNAAGVLQYGYGPAEMLVKDRDLLKSSTATIRRG